MSEKYRYSPTPSGYRAWLADGNTGTYDEFMELWAGAQRGEIIADIVEHLQQLNTRELMEVLEFIKSNYF
mgnify:CR=1 FL=1